MRVACVVSLAGLSSAVLGAPPTAVEAKAARDDAAVISAAIGHFSERKDEWSFIGREAKAVILVHTDSSGPRGSDLSDELTQSDLRGEKWELPAAVADDLLRRNARAVPLTHLTFGACALVADLKKVSHGFSAEGLPKEYCEAKGYAYVWLPGYSEDGATAVVRFAFGPTAHGATATYLLVKAGGAWAVTKASHTYYV